MAGGRTFPSEKFFDLVDDAVDISGPDRVIPIGHLNKARPRDLLRELASRCKLYPRIGSSVDDEGRDANAHKCLPNVDLGVHPRESDRRRRTDRQAFEAGPPRLEARIVNFPGRECSQ